LGAERKGNSIGRVLASLCEPYLEPFRKIIPPIGMIDISPIVAIFVLKFADAGLLRFSECSALFN
jgi:YggT family protein